MTLVAILLLLPLSYAVRPYCEGGSCNTSQDCVQPSGIGGATNGLCCNTTGPSLCYAPGNAPPVKQGQMCDTTQCFRTCDVGLSCANANGQVIGGIGVVGPFTCQKILSLFTPGCNCNLSSQCFGGLCGSTKSVCYASSLYSGSSCQFGQQCISGFCDGGSCRGRDPNVRTATCSDSTQCPPDNRCSRWGVPPVKICHGLSGSGGMCYDDTDCRGNRFQIYPTQACVGTNNGVNAGSCVGLPGLNEVCGTTTTPSLCQLYTENGVEQPYSCNGTMNPPRCVKPISIPLNQPCNATINGPFCVATAYCAMLTQQMPTYIGQPGICTTLNNVPLGGNCSDASACQGTAECRTNSTSGLDQCQASSFLTTCNHTDSTNDDVQCPSADGNLVCACNNSCIFDGTSDVSCNAQQDARWNGLFFDESDIDPSLPVPAWADFRIDRRALADRVCCTQCGTTAESASVLTVGVVVDCGSLSISVPQICDAASAKAQAWLQNCGSYKPNAGALVTVSSFVVLLSILSPLLAYVYN